MNRPKKIRKPFLCTSVIVLTMMASTHSFAQTLQVMSFNIRYDNPQDGENRWDNRKKNLASMLRFYEVDLCGMQEALIHQIRDLKAALPEYEYIGKGRDDGREAGEFSPIFYRKDRIRVLESGTFWLSPSPDTPSRGWDAMLPRVVTWAKIKTIKGNKTAYVFNTHYDHMGEIARRESSNLLLRKIAEMAGKSRVVVTGDFNAIPSQDPIRILLDTSNPGHLTDTESLTRQEHFGPYSTFNGFEAMEQEGRHIDYIFLKNFKKMQVLRHGTLSNTWSGRFASDHHAVLAELSLK
ncbi:MAG TPA: endonuclease/exonuclease/phosphatase family protein [Saprospiraceae bacterium]|nr:endonuclease/exonuclease/phosphatase family protein [Saprospiraceae bacterium]HNT21749.1 endonuclease/exonuclease/phosphatase family protein [Saprospiraceae bacterium]